MEIRDVDPGQGVNLEELDKDVRSKHPGEKLFHVEVPYVGHYYFRGQNQKDVKESATAVDNYVKKKIAELGGQDAVRNLAETERDRIARETDAEAGDISNEIILRRCVVYPYDFNVLMDEERVKSGVIPLLLDKIMEVSGWIDVEVREV